MKPEAIDQLIKPFKPEQLKKRQGGRKELTYVDGAVVVERLNQVFEHNWTWEILDSRIDPAPVAKNGKDQHDVTVRGRLTVRDGDREIVKEAFGGVRVGPFGAGECRGDDLKGAATDALKKAASLLGVGLHLYSEDVGGDDAPDPEPRRQQQKPPATKSQGQQQKPKPEPTQTITTGQTARVVTLARALGLSDEALAAQVAKRFKRQLHQLTRTQADELIAAMGRKASAKPKDKAA